MLLGNGQQKDTASGGQSFTASTRVLLPGGKTAPISTLKPGQKVLANDTKTGKTQPEAVTAVLVHHDTNLYDLTVKTSTGTEVIHTTASHLFWDLDKWVTANKLSKDERLKAPDGATVTVVSGTTPADHDGWMWDLTVPGNNDHDFYVLPAVGDDQAGYGVVAGGTPVLVHNNNDPCSVVSGVVSMGGRRGSAVVRNQLDQVRDDLLNANPDWDHVAGGRVAGSGAKLPEQAVVNPANPSQWRFPDLTFRLPDGSPFYVNTVDTYASGAATIREFEAAVDINLWGGGPVLMIPKP